MGCGMIVLLSIMSMFLYLGIVAALGEDLVLVLTVFGLLGYGLIRLLTREEKTNPHEIKSSEQTKTVNNASVTAKPQTGSSKPETVQAGDYQISITDNLVEIVRFTSIDSGTIEIPAVIDNLPVKVIGKAAFKECKQMTKVIIPEGVTSIQEEAFYECSKLCEANLPSTLNRIRKSAFAKCSMLEKINLPNGLRNIPEECFSYCYKLCEVQIPETVRTIEKMAFMKTGLKKIKMPKNLQRIEENAFFGCDKLPEVILSDSLYRIDAEVFAYCKELKEIIIPKSVTEIAENAFSGISEITLYCYGGSYGLEFAREHNLPYKDAEELIRAKKLETQIAKESEKPKIVEKPKTEQFEKAENKTVAVPEKNEKEETNEQKGLEKEFRISGEYIADSHLGRIIRKEKYAVLFDIEYEDEDDIVTDGTMLIWEGDEHIGFPFTAIVGCEYYFAGYLEDWYGKVTGYRQHDGIYIYGCKPPKDGLVIYFENFAPYVMEYENHHEDAKKNYDILRYVLGDRRDKCPFAIQEEKTDMDQNISAERQNALVEVHSCLKQIYDRQIMTLAMQIVAREKMLNDRQLLLAAVHSCLVQMRDQQIMELVLKVALRVKEELIEDDGSQEISAEHENEAENVTFETDLSKTTYGRVIRHSKYNIIFQMDYDDKGKAEMDGNLIVWEDANRISWPVASISGCEYLKDGRRKAYCGQLTKLSKERLAAIGHIQRPKHGLVLHFKGYRPYVILDFVRSSEKLENVYETMAYVLGDRTGRCPFRRKEK